jgi:hypothetical protein
MENKIKINKLKEIPIDFVLSKYGIKAVKTRYNCAWYFAFDREENTASIKVDSVMNRFYDHGIGKGGSVIDIVMLIQRCTLNDAIQFLSDFDGLQMEEHIKTTRKLKIENSSIFIFKVQKLVHPPLLEYLEKRFIELCVAEKYCHQVHYNVSGKNYFGIGFLNDQGGYEIRSKYFKGGSSPKTITSILNGSKELVIFEGFFDFLSYLTIKPEKQKLYDFIILNSVSNHVKITPEIIIKYDLVYLFLDNDNAGKKTTELIQNKTKKVFDYSTKYEAFNDLNEYLIHEKTLELQYHKEKKK